MKTVNTSTIKNDLLARDEMEGIGQRLANEGNIEARYFEEAAQSLNDQLVENITDAYFTGELDDDVKLKWVSR